MEKFNGINVVFLYVHDIAKMRSFYEAAFNLSKPLVDAKWWVEYAFGSGSHLALHQVQGDKIGGAVRQKGTVRFSVDVTNIQKCVEKLKGLGAKFLYDPRAEYGFQLAEFEDPEGNILRLYEKAKK